MIDRAVGFDTETTKELTAPTLDSASVRGNLPTTSVSSTGNSQDLHARVSACIGCEMREVESVIRSATESEFPVVNEISGRAAAMGGKRLRPMLVLLSAQGCLSARSKTGWNSDARAVAAAVELVHAASLVHDDVMDGAVERRHQPTIVHAKGISAAVLLGDYLFTRAYAMAASCRSTLPARQIAAAATRLCEGELRQQASTGNWQISWSEYRSILTQKTAALCAVSCRLGGWLSGASPREQLALNRFGRELGLAFQIYDDWLDYWGTDRVGKTLGTDLAQLKPTLPLIRLLSQSKSAERRRVIELLEQGSPAALEGVRAALERSDAGDFTLRVAQRCAQGALSSLAPLRASVAKECLMAIADYSVTRVV